MPEFSPESLCRWIVEESRTRSSLRTGEGIIRLWNLGAAEMFGFGASEALGRPLDLIIPEGLRARHNEGYRRVMAEGVSKYAQDLLAVPGQTQDGRRLSLEFHHQPWCGTARGKSWAPPPSSGRYGPLAAGTRK